MNVARTQTLKDLAERSPNASLGAGTGETDTIEREAGTETAASPEAQQAAQSQKFALNTLRGDVATELVKLMRQMDEGWPKQPEHRQGFFIEEADRLASMIVRRATILMGSQGFEMLQVRIPKFTVDNEKDTIKLEIRTTANAEHIARLLECETGILVLANPQDFMGQRAQIRPQPDQPDLLDAAEEAELEIGDTIEFRRTQGGAIEEGVIEGLAEDGDGSILLVRTSEDFPPVRVTKEMRTTWLSGPEGNQADALADALGWKPGDPVRYALSPGGDVFEGTFHATDGGKPPAAGPDIWVVPPGGGDPILVTAEMRTEWLTGADSGTGDAEPPAPARRGRRKRGEASGGEAH